MVGRLIEHYRLVSLLGEGGMGVVYKAFDEKLERYVAIKIISPAALQNPKFVERFKREAKNQAKLLHQNIVPVYGLIEDYNLLGIVMVYVDGETLEHVIISKGRLEVVDALKVLRQILIGAGYAHSKGFIHRDLKPSNIIISQDGTVKIMDFGISKSVNEEKELTRAGTKVGTILYMSPEQIKALELTNQSDIYSIGITFYEMLSGKTPFDYKTEYEILEAHLKKDPVKLYGNIPFIPSEVDSIIAKALNKNPAKRYKDCEEFLFEVDRLIAKLSNKVKNIPVEKKVKFRNPKQTLAKLKFYFLTFLFICLFGVLFYFVYSTVAQFWKHPNNVKMFDEKFSMTEFLNFQNKKWKKLNSNTDNDLNDICFINDSYGFACGNNSTFLTTENGGENWQVVFDSSGIDYLGIKFFSYQKGFIIGSKGTILETNDGGKTFKKIQSGVSESLFKIYFLPGNIEGFIVGANGTILKTLNGGNTWQKIPILTNELLYSITFINDATGFAVGRNGTILKTSDSGNTWQLLKKQTDQYLRDICFENENYGIIVGGNGQILKTNNGGDDWELIHIKTSSGLYSVQMIDNNHWIILSSNGEVVISTNSGKEWDINSTGFYTALTSSAIISGKKIIVTGYDGLIITN